MRRRREGPTARIIEFAMSQPGHLITWSEAKAAYARGLVMGYDNVRRGAASQHKMSVSNVLYRHFLKVGGAVGVYVLSDSIRNDDEAGDTIEMESFHRLFGSDEFGMSTRRDTPVVSEGRPTGRFHRMSAI